MTVMSAQPRAKKTPTKKNNPRGGNGKPASVVALSNEEAAVLLAALVAVRNGDFSARLPVSWTGLHGRIADNFNDMVATQARLADELERISFVVGQEGRISQRARLPRAVGAWADEVDSVNSLISALVWPTSEMARVVGSVARGDLTQTVSLEMEGRPLAGEFLRTARIVNTMVQQLTSFTSEVTRVAREVGTEGKLGGQARIKGLSGTWKDLTDNVNVMANNLTAQVRSIAEVTIAVANGDLSKKITVDVRGEILQLKEAINTMVDQLRGFASEVTRVAREVGTEGKLGGQAYVPGVAGTWKDLTDNVNFMATNLTNQVRNIAEVTTAVARGDLSKKITVDVKGEILELKNTINTMVDQLSAFASEVTRVAREVGTEGKLGGQANVPGVGGVWKDLTDNVNLMANNLTGQVRNIAEVATAVATGDLSKKITVDVRGEILALKNTINLMVDQLNSFASEVTRVAREVGTEGKLGGQAEVAGVSGIWKNLTDNVNLMASNLTNQVRNIAEVTTAVARGDLSKKITVDVKGEILALKNTINTMVDQLSAFAAEVTRVAREVGTEGKLGGQANVPGVDGVWKDLTDNVNLMGGNLTGQVRNIADVATAIAAGDLSRKITVDVRGEILALKNTINQMVDQLRTFASEVTRVAREVGTEGKLGGQASVPGVAGTWKDLTDNVNFMASNLTGQVRNIAEVATAVANGDLSKKITVDVRGEILQLKETINTMVDQLRAFASEVTRVAREVGTEGKLGGQAYVPGVAGTWKDLTDNVNSMASNLTGQVRNIAEVATAIAAGDLSKKITVDVRGEILALKNTINTMVDQLNSFASEVTRVARDVGTEGKLGGQASVSGAAGVWKDLTDNVNVMAANLTDQVRNIARVVTAVARGNLKQKLTVQAKGEIAALTDTINEMTDTLAIFADQVTTVAREVGVEGQLGGQASVPGAAGIWKDLTDNVNQLAANLTTQVRAIAEVATAVTRGDLTRSIIVAARGEVAELKDNINTMIRNLRETTQQNAEQDWLKTNLTRFTRLLQGQRDALTVSSMLLSELSPLVGAAHAVVYVIRPEADDASTSGPILQLLASYGYTGRKGLSAKWAIGEGLVGQCALEKQRILLTNVPPGYIEVTSGLGEAAPLNIVVLPVVFENDVKAVIELASFERFSPAHIIFLEQLTESLGIVLNTIEATMRTEELLTQSQSLAGELQSRQQELQNTNAELEEKARLLASQNTEVERKNQEVEEARQALEEKAEQLALTSKYKSEFLANMSHELRTPLNSLLILAGQLAKNAEGNLGEKQVDYARTIQASGTELLTLINDILDLTKIESGTVTVEVEEALLSDVRDQIERTFRHIAEARGLDFSVELDPALPLVIYTDADRLQQVLKNLASNAIKFTEQGQVRLRIFPARSGWNPEHEILNRAQRVLAFEVSDTGIGVPPDKQKLIFEAFQQAEGGASRKYAGTGLGLAISREIANLLGGELTLTKSVVGQGSVFTFYLAESHEGHPRHRSRPASRRSGANNGADAQAEPFADDRVRLQAGDLPVLIVEDDPAFARILLNRAHGHGFKVVVATRGEEVLTLARQYRPLAITLDLGLPDLDGRVVLDRLKLDPATRHIPVHIISADDDRRHGLGHGAFGYMVKPVDETMLGRTFDAFRDFATRRNRRLLLAEDNLAEQRAISALLEGDDLEIETVATGKEALAALEAGRFDCLVLDLKLPDVSGFEVLKRLEADPALRDMPAIVYTGRELTRKESAQLQKVARTIIVKDVHSPERLLAETTLFLHRNIALLPDAKRQMLESVYQSDAPLTGKRILIVDDDVRNLYAITGVLESHRMEVFVAKNGRTAIDLLEQAPETDLVLMDIMMPQMDGYDTMRAIRRNSKFRALPIIALTAKAMKGDREKCLEAGASDYISKPVNVDQLLSLMRIWLYR